MKYIDGLKHLPAVEIKSDNASIYKLDYEQIATCVTEDSVRSIAYFATTNN